MQIYLREELRILWQGKDPFVEVDKIQGKIFKHKEGRKTLYFKLNGKAYFLKLHKGVGWKEIAKNLLQLRLPVLGARNEQRAILALTKVGVGTLSIAAFGEKGINPAKKTSFIITDAIKPSLSLQRVTSQWRKNPPDLQLKRATSRQVCRMIRLMHENNINHRDLYLCHFLWRRYPEKKPDLALVDLHRALIHKKLPYRWRVKDLAGIYYSAMDMGLTKGDCFRFIKAYSKKTLRAALTDNAAMWREVERKAKKLYGK
uniref:Heptose I phosphotransferase n=1 Tax=Candidatus Kentrum eta TaxID=2126337 RepID=A0A450VKB9_9GAMM|nr:MAG: heptose I phosphotransferase [Candidatus Kentron sp. H]VFK02095.1 MAG: heptose I phosphotransferase [Candidatus Kentron sp. H]VFK05266.1 MAG: heptose I phosphotransferase [Candidatus Kentron sp. H]